MASLSSKHLALFALPALVTAPMHNPMLAGIIATLYSSRFGLDLSVIGGVMLAARLFDAVTDPVMGFLSDRTVSRYGRRKPWVVTGAALLVVCIWFLFRPGEVSTTTYFLVFSILMYLGWTIMEIPYLAWMLEMSRDARDRTTINAFRSAAVLAGAVVFYLLPSLIPGANGSMSFQVLGILAIIIAVSMPISVGMAVRYVPERSALDTDRKPTIVELWHSISSNKPFLVFLAMYAFIGIGGGIANVVAFMFIDSYLQIGNRFTELFLPGFILGPLILPLWTRVMNRYGKYRTAAISFTVYMLIMPLPWFVEPGESAFLPMLIIFTSGSLILPLLMVAMPAILGDVIDWDELQTGKNRAGQYSSFLALIAKGTAAVAGPLAFVVIGVLGYQPGSPDNTESAIYGLRVVFAIAPALCILPGILLLWFFPINDSSQRTIKANLDKQTEQKAVI